MNQQAFVSEGLPRGRLYRLREVPEGTHPLQRHIIKLSGQDVYTTYERKYGSFVCEDEFDSLEEALVWLQKGDYDERR